MVEESGRNIEPEPDYVGEDPDRELAKAVLIGAIIIATIVFIYTMIILN